MFYLRFQMHCKKFIIKTNIFVKVCTPCICSVFCRRKQPTAKMPDLIIENKAPTEIKKSGRRPSSQEYEIGTKIYSEFKVGNCSFFPNEIKYKSLLSRLSRLNEKNGTDYEFTVRKDSILGDKVNIGISSSFSNDRVSGGGIGGGVNTIREIIEGFRLYRVK